MFAKLALRLIEGLINPRQFGPISLILYFLIVLMISFVNFFPSSPISVKPAEIRTIPETPALPQSSTIAGTVLAGAKLNSWESGQIKSIGMHDLEVVQGTMNKLNELYLYPYIDKNLIAFFVSTIVIQNKSSDNLKLRVDCSKSINSLTNRGSLDWAVEVDQKSAIIAHQLMPLDERKPWKVVSTIKILT